MQFVLVHSVGNRERWQTSNTLSKASATILADEISAIKNITGVKVNPRTGSVTVTFADTQAQTELRTYLASLVKNPPILRPGRKAPTTVLEAKKEVSCLLNPSIEPVEKWVKSKNMPFLTRLFQSIVRGFREMPILHLANSMKQGRFELVPPETEEKGGADRNAELDFSSLSRYVFVRPLLPMLANIANAVLGSIPILIDGVKALFKGQLNVAVLDAAAILISLIRRDFKTVGLLVLLLGLGEMLENYTRKKSLASLADQLALKVETVWVRRDGELAQIRMSELTKEDAVVVRAGSVIPVDGVVISGDASVNQATMTGEPLPVHRTQGGSVFAGTVVEDGEIDIRPTAFGDASRLSQIVNFIENSEQLKAGIQGKAEHLADAIVPYNFLLAGLVWLFTRDLTRTASVLLVDYSCALRLATPLAILTSMRRGTEKGLLVKGGRYLEALAEVDTVVFDKTGTLTQASPNLSDVIPVTGKYSREELLGLAACLEEHFPHPVSRAIVRKADEEEICHDDERHDAHIEYIVAHGICSSVCGSKIILGSRHFLEDDEHIDLSAAQEIVQNLADEGKSILYMAVDGILECILGIEDPLRPDAKETVAALRARGIKNIIMLTGDDKRTAHHVASELGLDGYHAQVLPTDKASHVEALTKAGHKVLMIGDGINDSPALSAAHVGATLRDGTDIAQEVADVVLTENRLSDLPNAIDLGHATLGRIKENFAVSVGLNSIFLIGGLTGLLMPAAGALLHNVTTLGVCLNAMRTPLTDKKKNLRETLSDIRMSVKHTLAHVENNPVAALPKN